MTVEEFIEQEVGKVTDYLKVDNYEVAEGIICYMRRCRDLPKSTLNDFLEKIFFNNEINNEKRAKLLERCQAHEEQIREFVEYVRNKAQTFDFSIATVK